MLLVFFLLARFGSDAEYLEYVGDGLKEMYHSGIRSDFGSQVEDNALHAKSEKSC